MEALVQSAQLQSTGAGSTVQQSAVGRTTVTTQLRTIARQQDKDEGRLHVEHLLANVDSILKGVFHCLVAALMPHCLGH